MSDEHFRWTGRNTADSRFPFGGRRRNSTIRESRKIWKNRSATNYVSAVAPRIASNHFRFFLLFRPWKIEWPFPCDWKEICRFVPTSGAGRKSSTLGLFKKKMRTRYYLALFYFPRRLRPVVFHFHWLWSVVYCRKLRLFVGQISKWWWTAAISWEKNFFRRLKKKTDHKFLINRRYRPCVV